MKGVMVYEFIDHNYDLFQVKPQNDQICSLYFHPYPTPISKIISAVESIIFKLQ